jgi:hypothetical protein
MRGTLEAFCCLSGRRTSSCENRFLTGAALIMCGSGQRYKYDEENRLTAIRRESASPNGPAGQLLRAYECGS